MLLQLRAFAFCGIFMLSLACGGFAAHALEQQSTAQQVYIKDIGTGAVLFEKSAQDKMPTSSMSKVMTMYAVFRALKAGQLSMDDELTVSEKAWRKGGSKMFVEVGKKVKVEDLIKGVIVQSGNDASIVLAENLAGTEENFALNLNIIAQELGMENSNFTNASGWPDPNHYSTAEDLAILAERLIRDFPQYYNYYAMKEFTYNDIKQSNRNPLLYRKMGVDGIKTGHTEVAGYGLMASGARDGRRVVMVANGMDSEKHRAQESARLMEWALSAFENKTLYAAGAEIARVPVLLGQSDSVPIVLQEEVRVTLPKIGQDDVKIEAVYKEPLEAPVQAGIEAGTLIVTIPGQEPQSYKLYTGQDVPAAGFVKRAFEKLIILIGNG